MFMKVVRAILYICLAAVILVTGLKIEMKLNEYRTALDIHTERTMEVRKGRNVDFGKLLSENSVTVGWIYLPDSNIDYPVVQAEDNDYYLHRDFDGSYLYDGCIFADASNEAPFCDDNTILYGHRMMSGAMFADLKRYEDKEYMDSHRIIQIETPERSYDLHVVAFCMEDADSDLYTTWFSDNISLFSAAFDDIEPNEEGGSSDLNFSKDDYVELVRSKAVTLSGEPFSAGDTFVTLSTCARSLGDDRNQVICVVKDAKKSEKVTEIKIEKPFINKWLLLQIAVGLVMALAILLPLVPKGKGKRNGS